MASLRLYGGRRSWIGWQHIDEGLLQLCVPLIIMAGIEILDG